MKSKFFIKFMIFLFFINRILLFSQKNSDISKLGSILIINSYNPGYAWSDDEQAGIIEVFKSINKNWFPYIEYLDCKRFEEKKIFNDLAKLLINKYHDKIFSAVIVMDDPALDFILKYQKYILLKNSPVVFCGINNYDPSLLKDKTNITGIIEALDPEGTIKIMLQLHPSVDNILVITDDTISGLGMKDKVKSLTNIFSSKVKFNFIENISMDDLLKKLEKLPENFLVLDMGFITDKYGNIFQITETSRLFSQYSSVPVYSVHAQKLGSGIVGGKLFSAKDHGIAAAKLVLRILKGENVSGIPVIKTSTSIYMFDYKVMKKYNIPLTKLPKKSIIINKPIPFYKANKNLILLSSLIILFLILIICFLAIIIVQRNISSQKILHSEERYRMLFEDSPISLWEVDFSKVKEEINKIINSGIIDLKLYFETNSVLLKNYITLINILNVNKISVKLFKADNKDHLIQNINNIFISETFDIFQKALIHVIKGNYIFNSEIVFKTLLDDKFIANMNLSLSSEYKESWSKVLISLTDITDSKKTEQTLREAESRYRELFEHINSGVAVYDVKDNGKDFIFKDFNQAGEKIDNDKKEELIGKSIFDVRPGIKEFGLTEIFKKVWETGEPSYMPITLYKDNKINRWYENFVYKLPSGEIVAVFNDLTEKKRSEEERDRLFNLSIDMLCIAGFDGFFKQLNPAWEKTLGWTIDELKSKSWLNFVHDDDKQATIEAGKQLIKGKTVVNFENRYYHKNENYRWFSWNAFPLLDDKLIFGVIRDITEQKKAEEQIKTSLKEKETLLHELYHRTKNNMQVICAMLSLQSNYIDNDQVKIIFKEIENKINSMALVHQKLYKSQNLSSINLKDYILELTQLLLNSYKVTSNRINLDLTNIDDINVTIDTAIPCGLLLNELISNSLKHAFPNDKKGEIKIQLLKKENDQIKLEISDNGIGTPKEFNFRTSSKMGLQSIFAIAEHQLQGEVKFDSNNGLICTIIFKNNLYKERI